jgi:hypothetical protein
MRPAIRPMSRRGASFKLARTLVCLLAVSAAACGRQESKTKSTASAVATSDLTEAAYCGAAALADAAAPKPAAPPLRHVPAEQLRLDDGGAAMSLCDVMRARGKALTLLQFVSNGMVPPLLPAGTPELMRMLSLSEIYSFSNAQQAKSPLLRRRAVTRLERRLERRRFLNAPKYESVVGGMQDEWHCGSGPSLLKIRLLRANIRKVKTSYIHFKRRDHHDDL